MVKYFAVIAFSVATLASSAHAADTTDTDSVVSSYMQMIKMHGKQVQMHVMTMKDGTVLYGFTKADLERFMNRALPRH